MQFKNWIKQTEYMEMSDIQNMPTDSVNLEPLHGEEFDENEAEKECDHELRYKDFSDLSGIYDYPEDDPDFDMESPQQWEEENPQPDPDEYEHNTKDEDYIKDLNSWEKERQIHLKQYHEKKVEWEAEMHNRRVKAEDKESEARYEAIQNCIEAKRDKHDHPERTKGGFSSQFTHKNEEFEVTMERKSIKYAGHNVPGSFEIAFVGPNGYYTTNTAGNNAPAIYTQVLLAVKKLMATQVVNGISFAPAEPGMALVYQRFYDRFLKNDFVRINKSEAVRKTFIDKINQQLNPNEKAQIDASIKSTEQETNAYLNQIKNNRGQERQIKIMAQTMLYKVLKKKDGHNIFVARVFMNKNTMMVEGITDDNNSPEKIPLDDITQIPADMNSGNKLLTIISQNSKWMSKINQKAFDVLAKQYGVNQTTINKTASWQHI